MRVLVQRVARAAVEAAGCVEGRIGPGLVLTVAVTKGDTSKAAETLAAKVLSLNLFPEVLDPDAPFCTNVVDNGSEILVLLQQTLCATFPTNAPNQEKALCVASARPIFDAFVAKLKEGYQEEMIIAAPPDQPSLRVDMTLEGSGTFELSAGAGAASAPTAAPKAGAARRASGNGAAPPPRPSQDDDAGENDAADEDDDLEKQLAELKEEVADPLKGIDAARKRRAGLPVKEEQEATIRVRPDISGRAAPETPAAAAARQWAANRRGGAAQAVPQYGGKAAGKGPRPARRCWGIVSLDGSSQLHAVGTGGFGYGQHNQGYTEKAAEPPAKKLRELPKGTPTVAPMCPAPGEEQEDL